MVIGLSSLVKTKVNLMPKSLIRDRRRVRIRIKLLMSFRSESSLSRLSSNLSKEMLSLWWSSFLPHKDVATLEPAPTPSGTLKFLVGKKFLLEIEVG